MAIAHRCRIWMIALVVLCAMVPPTSAQQADGKLPSAILYLTDGDLFAGRLADSETPNVVSWQIAEATGSFQFPITAIRSVYFPAPARPVAAEADFCFELTDGDQIFGSLTGLNAENAEIQSPRFGRVQVARSQISRVMPWKGEAAWQYSGPNGLSDWKHEPAENGWREEAGHLFTEQTGASLFRNVEVPQKARVELAISWTQTPNFIFGVSASAERPDKEGFQFEVWNKSLVAVGEFGREADVAAVCDLTTVKNRLHLQMLLDRETGLCSIHALDGKKLAQIQVKSDGRPLLGLSLRNLRGDVRLEQIVVSRWNGQSPPAVDLARQRIHQSNGSIVYGDIVRYDATAQQFVVQNGAEEKAIDARTIASAVLTPAAQAAPAEIRIGCHDGSRLSGQLVKVEAGRLHISRAGFVQPIVLPAADVRFLVGTGGGRTETQVQPAVGRLELKGVRSHGTLVDGKANGQTGCLIWQPRHSITSSPLNKNVSGRIVYRDPPPPPPQVRNLQAQVRRQPGFRQPGLMDRFVEAFTAPPPGSVPARLSGYPHALFLLAGDRIPCTVYRIDEEGVHFTSPVVESETVPHEQIKALELVPRTAAATLAEEKRTRLLTLPRMQKNNPPTHLIASTSGDYLRGRVQLMDPQTLSVETRLETKRLPRGRIACIIWLHPASEDKKQPANNVATTPTSARIQAVRVDGVRLTFTPNEFVNNSLVGNSELLGASTVDVKTVDRILLGDMIEASTDETLYGAWCLRNAVEPMFAQDDAQAGGASPAGLNSTLVSKPAPDFRLALLEGGNYKLSDAKGRIVVLDFWATWCAPCMQGMPEVYRVTKEFEDQDVEFVAVNMQEDRATISGALDRLKIQPAVAMDIDGATAEKFEVSAIPQTVIIDRNGNVARIFIGADPNFADQLREAIQQLVGANEADSAANTP